jgi:hypothetical protein
MCEVGQDEFIEQDHIIASRSCEITRRRHQPLNLLQNGLPVSSVGLDGL